MGTYNIDQDLTIFERSLHESILGSPVELQLVWLYEILSILLFVKVLKLKPELIRKSGTDLATTSFRKCRKLFKPKTYALIMNLGDFRNAYVHQGCTAAYNYFTSITSVKGMYDELALNANIVLNWNKSLYNATCK